MNQVTHSFTAPATSAELLVQPGRTLTYGIGDEFTGTLLVEYSRRSVTWTTIQTLTAAGSGSFVNSFGFDIRVRVRATALASGTASVVLTDEVAADNNAWSEMTLGVVGNQDNLAFNGADLVRLTNASAVTIRGLAAGRPGQRVTLVSVGAGQVNLAHQQSTSSADNRLVNFITSGLTYLAPGVGMATYQYDGTTQRWRLVDHEQGAWIRIPYAAGNYSASGAMTWTVQEADANTNAIYTKGRTVMHSVAVVTSSIAGTPGSELYVAIPFTVAAGVFRVATRIIDNGTGRFSFMDARTGPSRLIFFADATLSNWAASTNNTAAVGLITYEVE